MKHDEAASLQQELRNWEFKFSKEHSRKPTKSDILSDENVGPKYEAFLRYKKSVVLCSQKTEAKPAQGEKVGPVWGQNLLKKNMKSPPKFENSKKSQPKPKTETKTSQSSWRSALRKNISKSPIKRKPLSFRNDCNTANELGFNNSDTVSLPHTESLNKSNEEKSLCNTSLPIIKNNVFSPVTNNPNISKTPTLRKCVGRASFFNRTTAQDWTEEQNDTIEESFANFKPEPIESFSDRKACNNFSMADFKSNTLDIEFNNPTTNFEDSLTEKALKSLHKEDKVSGNTSVSYSDICLQEDDTSNRNIPKTTNCTEITEEDSFSKKTLSDEEPSTSAQPRSNQLVSNNFIRVNMKKKVYKGKGSSGKFLRKQVLRKKMMAKGLSMKSGWKGRSGGRSYVGNGRPVNVGLRDMKNEKCFKCGETGHWSSKCPNRFGKRTKEAPDSKESLEDVLSTLQAETGFDSNMGIDGYFKSPVAYQQISVQVAESLSELALDEPNHPDIIRALKMFGYESFRPGQYRAISRILKGEPTLLVLATGSGKSLCYQLPAYLYATKRNAITIVVSPLVSLMDDQVHGLPKMLKAVRLHSGMTKVQRTKVMEKLESGEVHVLLLSPEALTTWAGMSAHTSPLGKLPPIAFVCVDECHCLSEWSHSFRPSYLRVCKVLIDQLGVKCMVGLTATATMDTCLAVAKQLGISNMKEGIIAKMEIPKNLVLTASRDKYKEQSLMHLISGERFKTLNSIIVYCTRRDECARVATLLRTQLQDMPAVEDVVEENEQDDSECSGNSKKRKRNDNGSVGAKRKAVQTWAADCYHAGMSTSERRKIQTRFMSGRLRIVVATVAFGMGIDKQDVRSVIHYNSPRSFERYVQEIGRAGRDGKPAHCHLFQDAYGGDLSELSRHTYAKSVDRFTIKKLIMMVFPTCTCNQSEDWDDWTENSTVKVEDKCKGHFVSIPIDSAVEKLDLSKEGIETLLCFLELEGYISVHLPTETKCTIDCYGGSKQMMNAAKKCPPVAMALKMAEKKKSNEAWQTEVEFNAAQVADKMGMNLSALKKLLNFLMWDTSLSSECSAVGKSGIAVEFTELSFCIQTKTAATNDFLDKVTDMLYLRSVAQERKELAQLKMCFDTMQKYSYANVGLCSDLTTCGKSENMKQVIKTYFQTVHENKHPLDEVQLSEPEISEVKSLVKSFLATHGNDVGRAINGRAIARIFHGISSPRYPAENWGSVRNFWRCKLKYNFNAINKIATEVLVSWYT